MWSNIALGLAIPFIGTSLGAACAFLMKKEINRLIQRILTGFAAGVMVAASIWSLLIPSLEQSEDMGSLSFIPAVTGFWVGILFLFALDHLVPHLHMNVDKAEGPVSKMKRSTMMVTAVTIHNIPEGMAAGVVFAGWMAGSKGITLTGAIVLSLGLAIQNFPEGAIVSMPLKAEGESKLKAFLLGVMSGAVEPLAGLITIFAFSMIVSSLPYMLSFAAGAMIYVVVEELIPEMSEGDHSNAGVIFFAVGFTLMMTLDVALG